MMTNPWTVILSSARPVRSRKTCSARPTAESANFLTYSCRVSTMTCIAAVRAFTTLFAKLEMVSKTSSKNR